MRSLFLAVECSYDVKNIKKKILETPFFSGSTRSVGVPLVPLSALRLYRGPNSSRSSYFTENLKNLILALLKVF